MPTRTTHRPRRPAPHGITIVEVLVALACVLVLAAAAPVFMQSTGDRARIAQSVANLKNLAAAQEAYGGDWNDRQFTPIPDDAGLAGGECAKYIETIGFDIYEFGHWSFDVQSPFIRKAVNQVGGEGCMKGVKACKTM
jgi:type II secretory pathway pseudopilin PulG